MPGMFDVILRAPVFGRLSRASRIPGAAASPLLADIITRLGDPNDNMVDIAADMGFYSTPAQESHVRKDWLNEDPGGHPGFWPTIRTEPIMRAGLKVACERFRDTGKPLEFLWVMSGDQYSTTFEVSITECRDIVLVVFHTPPAPCLETPANSQSMWIVRYGVGNVLESRPVKIPLSLFPDPPPVPSARTVVAKKPPKKKRRKKPSPTPPPKKRKTKKRPKR